ncbi:MAG: MFS transporter [Clostridia bacterium]|nr:MFS transporter [Clostridia bacterium]
MGVKNMSTAGNVAVNRAKGWQIALFPFNNAATNVYFAFYNYFVYWAVLALTGSTAGAIGGVVVSSVVAIGVSTFASLFAPLMRVFDGVTDPVLGGMMDKTKIKLGKFRPFMIIGNVMLAFSVILMMLVAQLANGIIWLQWVLYIISYIIYVLGYTCQCAVTKAGQTCLTNDPKQRSQFVIWNMIGMIGSIVLVNIMAGGVLTNEAICQKGIIFYEETVANGGKSVAEIITELGANASKYTAVLESLNPNLTYVYLRGAAYGAQFYNIMVPFVVVVSAIYTIMAVAAIWNKDRPEFWGVAGEPAKIKDYIGILKGNKEIRWLVLSSGLNKLASTVATSSAVAFLLYGCLMGDYNGLYIPFYALCFVFMGIFFLWGSKTAGRKGQKRGVAQFTVFAFLFYIGVLIMLCIYDPANAATHLSLFSMEGGFHLTINAYTIFFIILYGCGYGAFNCCDNLTIPMVADCTDYETYRSGKYVPGIMGTIFSLVDKLISSLQTLLLQLFIVVLVPGLTALPGESTTYMPGMQLSCIICFCVLPMLAWLVTTFCMTRYGLSGKRLQEVQAVNAVRKAAVNGGMTMEEAMKTWQTIDQVPDMFVLKQKPRVNKKTGQVIVEKENFLDKIYNKVFTKHEKVSGEPSSNAVDIPEEFRTDEIKELYANQSAAETLQENVEVVQSEPAVEETIKSEQETETPAQDTNGGDKEQK